MLLKVKGLNKSYNKNHILKNINFELKSNEILCIIGKSGGGKTTLLRCINDLEKYESGIIEVAGDKKFNELNKQKNYSYNKKNKSKKRIGLVFQNYNLFPHMTALENIVEAPINALGLSKKEAQKIALDLLCKLGLKNRANAYPYELSGGEKQRVAIARACALNPNIICFDEPTSALDPETTEEISKIIKELSNNNLGIIIVSHDMSFVKSIAQKVILLENGSIVKNETNEAFFNELENGSMKIAT